MLAVNDPPCFNSPFSVNFGFLPGIPLGFFPVNFDTQPIEGRSFLDYSREATGGNGFNDMDDHADERVGFGNLIEQPSPVLYPTHGQYA